MKRKFLGGLVAAGLLAVAPAGAQAFTVSTDGFEASSKPLGNFSTQSLVGLQSFTRRCTGPVHTGSCAAGTGALPPTISDTVLRWNPGVQGRGDGNNIQLSFWRAHSLESTFDGMVLETSVNNGPWVNFLSRPGAGVVQGGYNSTLTGGNPLAGRQAWSGNTGGYVRSVVNLGPLAFKDSTLRFRFRVVTDGSIASGGVRIDDVLLTASDGAYSPPVQPGDGKIG